MGETNLLDGNGGNAISQSDDRKKQKIDISTRKDMLRTINIAKSENINREKKMYLYWQWKKSIEDSFKLEDSVHLRAEVVAFVVDQKASLHYVEIDKNLQKIFIENEEKLFERISGIVRTDKDTKSNKSNLQQSLKAFLKIVYMVDKDKFQYYWQKTLSLPTSKFNEEFIAKNIGDTLEIAEEKFKSEDTKDHLSSLEVGYAFFLPLCRLEQPDTYANTFPQYDTYCFSSDELNEILSASVDSDAIKVKEALKEKLDNSGKYYSINDLVMNYQNYLSKSKQEEEEEKEGEFVDIEVSNEEEMEPPRNIIFFGPPGTGKSKHIECMIDKWREQKVKIIKHRTVFHPEYSYYDFVGQFKPVVGKMVSCVPVKSYEGEELFYSKSEGSSDYSKPIVYYNFVPGPFVRCLIDSLKENNNDDIRAVLIIEEINRGNCASIFGDIFQLLDRDTEISSKKRYYSEYPIHISHEIKGYIMEELKWDKDEWDEHFKEGILIPGNFFIFASMNTSDQSLFPIDAAFKRRWAMKYIPINYCQENEMSKEEKIPYITCIPFSEEEDVKWIRFIQVINDKIVNYTKSDDKQLGQWFVKNITERNNKGKYQVNPEDFQSKVLSYLWYDIFQHDPNALFAGDIRTYDMVVKRVEKNNGIRGIFESSIEESLFKEIDENS